MTGATTFSDARLDHALGLLRRRPRRGVVGRSAGAGHRGRLLPGRAQSGLVARRRLHLRVEHRVRARRRTGRIRRDRRRRAGPLRAARLVPARARLGVRAVLHAVDGLHDAGVPGTPVLGALAVRPVRRLADLVRRLEDRRRHLRRRRRVRRAAAGAQRHRSGRGTSTVSGSDRSSCSSPPASTRRSAACGRSPTTTRCRSASSCWARRR